MAYTPTQAPPNLRDHDELRKWVEEEFRRLAQAYTHDVTLTNTAAIAKLANNQFARVSLGANQTGLASSTDVTINYSDVTFDPSGIWNNSTKRFVPTVAGYYGVSAHAQLTWGGGAAATAIVRIRRNGATVSSSTYVSTATGNVIVINYDIVHVNADAADYIDFAAYMDGGASRDILASTGTFVTIQLVKAD